MTSKVFDIIKDKYPDARRDSLIPILQKVQDQEGFLSRDSIRQIGEFLSIPASKIYGVATFYNQFRFQPLGKNHILVCRGTACHVKGSANVLTAIESELSIKAGQTSRDGLFSLEVVACIGACGLAPVISINGEFFAGVTTEGVRRIIKKYQKMEKAAARQQMS